MKSYICFVFQYCYKCSRVIHTCLACLSFCPAPVVNELYKFSSNFEFQSSFRVNHDKLRETTRKRNFRPCFAQFVNNRKCSTGDGCGKQIALKTN